MARLTDRTLEGNTVKERVLIYLRDKRISQTEFCNALGVSPTYIGAMRKGIPADKMRLVRRSFPDLNPDWLLYGEGEMLLDPASVSRHRAADDGFEVLLLPTEAFAGNLQMWSDGIRESDCRRIVSPVPGADLAIPVKGDSMEPRFHDGSTLLIKRIDEKAFIPWGQPMVIDTVNGVLVKNVYPDESGEDFIEARSLNPKYPPIRIPTDSIYGIYRVIGSFDLYTTM